MRQLKRSPFKVNRIEKDPHAFGLRLNETIFAAEALYNGRSILISGQRGIGKSSFGSQLQRVLEGDNTLLKRCYIDTKLPRCLCVFYACGKENTLSQMVLDILFRIEQKSALIPKTDSLKIKPSFEINLGVVKAKLEAETSWGQHSPATIATQFASGLAQALNTVRGQFDFDGISIMIDELDQMSPDVNFGHFTKILHETLMREELERVSFIFAGQQGVYTRFMREDLSFERIVTHVPISILDSESADYVLEYAASQASPQFRYTDKGKSLILALSSGYPYAIHLIGDAAFRAMDEPKRITESDVLNGVETILKSDKREKYLGRMKELSDSERQVIIALSEYPNKTLPAEIPTQWLSIKLAGYFTTQELQDHAIESLAQRGYIILRKDGTKCLFVEELFRVFVSLARIEYHELWIRQRRADAMRQSEKKEDEHLLDEIRSGQLDFKNDLTPEEQESVIRKVRRILSQSEYTTDWEIDDLQDIYDQYGSEM